MRNGKSLHATGKSPFKVVQMKGSIRTSLCCFGFIALLCRSKPHCNFSLYGMDNSIKPAPADGGKKEPPAVVFLQQEVLLLLTRFIVISHPHKAAE